MSTDKSYVYGTEKEEKQLDRAEKSANAIKNTYEELIKEHESLYENIKFNQESLRNVELSYLKVSLEFDRLVLLLKSMDKDHPDYKNTLDAYKKTEENLSDVSNARKDKYEKESIIKKLYTDIISRKNNIIRDYIIAKDMVTEASEKLSLKKTADQKMKEQEIKEIEKGSAIFLTDTDKMLHKIMIAHNTWVVSLEQANIAKEAFMKELKKGRALGLFAL